MNTNRENGYGQLPLNRLQEVGTRQLQPMELATANKAIESVQVGERIDTSFSLREKFDTADEVFILAHRNIGDAIFTQGIVDAVAKTFSVSGKPKKISVLTAYPELLEGLTEQYRSPGGESLVTVQALPKLVRGSMSSGRNYADAVIEKINATDSKLFFINAFQPASLLHEILSSNAQDPERITIADATLERYVQHGNPPREMTVPPYSTLSSHGAATRRFIEMLLGQRLYEDPSQIPTTLPVTRKAREIGEQFADRNFLERGTTLYIFAQSGSIDPKQMTPDQTITLLKGLVQIARENDGEKRNSWVIFIQDPGLNGTEEQEQILAQINDPSVGIQNYVQPHTLSLQEIAGLAALTAPVSDTKKTPRNKVYATGGDSGIMHFFAARGIEILILYSSADPSLWTTGGANVHQLMTDDAREALQNHWPVIQEHFMYSSFSGIKKFDILRDVLPALKEMTKRKSRRRKTTN